MKNSKKTFKVKNSFMSLTKIARGYGIDEAWACEKWLSEPTTLEYIQLWESLHNLDFEKEKYIELCSEALSVGSCPSISKLNNYAKVSGVFQDKNISSQVFVHKDIAIDFASWVSPSFRTFCLLRIQNDYYENSFKFNSEEDFIISSKTLAEYTKKAALKEYKMQIIQGASAARDKKYSYFAKLVLQN